MSDAADYVICYDLSDDRERRRADRLLKGYGLRVQKSVFECRLGRRQAARLLTELGQLRLTSGQVILYRRQAGSARRVAGLPLVAWLDEAAFIL